ncbi:MAG: RES domain-containing protein [Acidobacteria bacterium]|nr:RES domain-containing protein [Acidobacteriota bacterium]
MRAFRLCRSTFPAYDGEGAFRVGGRWNSKGTRVLYMSENRALAVLEILVHLSTTIPDRYVLGSAQIPDDVAVEFVETQALPERWSTLDPHEQGTTWNLGDEWVRARRSAVLSVPSVVAAERNYLLNPMHPDFSRIAFADPVAFHFDARLSPSRGHGRGQAEH